MDVLGGAYDNGAVNITFLHTAAWNSLLNGDHDDIANGSVPTFGAAEHLDALHPPGAGIVGDFEYGF